MKKKIFAGVLALSMFLVPTARADELTDPYIKEIRNGNILPPQYEIRDDDGDGFDDDLGIRRDSPRVDEWIKSVESQDVGSIDNAVKWDKDKKGFKIKKVDQNGEPIEGVTFTAYNTKSDAENNKNPIDTATSNKDGDVVFKNVPLYYAFYLKETKVPANFKASKEIVPVYRDNGVRFLGEKDVTNSRVIKVGETEEEYDVNLNKYLQGLFSNGVRFSANKTVNWLVFNDNGKEKLIPKKPLKHNVSWDHINDAKLAFGEKELTLDGKRYKIRLMRAYNDNIDVNNGGFNNNSNDGNPEKGSEWNRLILPLIGVKGKEADTKSWDDYLKNPYGRFGYNTEFYTEQNMPVLAEYTWWKDFGGNSNSSGNYNKGSSYGCWRWTQNRSKLSSSSRANRGSRNANYAAADSDSRSPGSYLSVSAWLPVLELVD